MFGFKKHGTNILHYTFEYSKDGSYGASHSNFDEMLKLSKIDYNSFLAVLDHYPSSLIYNHSTVWIKDELKKILDIIILYLWKMLKMLLTNLIY